MTVMNTGQFKPGVHAWRKPQPHWEKPWLEREYITLKRSTGEIGKGLGITKEAVQFWLKKHGIPRRSVSEARAIKHWGVSGPANPMFGRTGPAAPAYVNGTTAIRQKIMSSVAGRAFVAAVMVLDLWICQRCFKNKQGRRAMCVHHLKSFARFPELRLEVSNGLTLCRQCHLWIHSRANVDREFLL